MTLLLFAELLNRIFSNPQTLDEARFSPTYFTRKRKMPFDRLLNFLIRGNKGSSQAELNEFFQDMGDDIHMTQQALSKARNHFDHTPFEKAFYETVNAEYNFNNDAKLLRFLGLKPIAIDGSITPLPNLPELKEIFGEVNGSPCARSSIALDVVNDRIVEAEFEPLNVDERTLALRHVHKLAKRINMNDALLIFDRGYPSKALIEAIIQAHAHFLMRVKQKFNVDIDAAPLGNSCVELGDGICVRVVKFKLPSGEVEALISDLFDMDESLFKELYFLRWPVEIKFDIVKNKLELPNFTGYSENIIRQDFWISMLLANAVAVAKSEADKSIQNARAEKENRYEYQMNINNAIASMRNRFADAVFCPDPILRMLRINKILEEVSASVVPKRPGRNVPRNNPRNVKFHHNKKSNV